MLGSLLHWNNDKSCYCTVYWTVGKVLLKYYSYTLEKGFILQQVHLTDKIGCCASLRTAWPLQFASCAYELKLLHTIVVQYTCIALLLSNASCTVGDFA